MSEDFPNVFIHVYNLMNEDENPAPGTELQKTNSI